MPEVNYKIPLVSFANDVPQGVSSYVFPCSNSCMVVSNAGNGVTSGCGMLGASRHKEGPGPGVVSRPVATPPLGMELIEPDINNCKYKLPVDEFKLKDEEMRLRRRLSEIEATKEINAAKFCPLVAEGESQSRRLPGFQYKTPDVARGPSSSADVDQREPLDVTLRSLVLGMGLPKIEVASFDGSPRDYFRFVKEFQSCVADKLVDEGQKLSYLLYYCRGQAKEAIQHCVLLPKESGYREALEILRRQFGRPHDVVRAVTHEVLHGPKLNPGDIDGLRRLARQMKACEITLVQLNRGADLDCSTNLVKIVERLPRNLQERWAEVAENAIEAGQEPTFRELLEFIEKRIAVSGSLYGAIASMNSFRQERANGDYAQAGRSRLYNIAGSISVCPLCHADHSLDECALFKAKTWEEKRTLLREHKCCFICLKRNHTAKDCKVTVRCTVPGCDRRHHSVMHKSPDKRVDDASSSTRCYSSACGLAAMLGFLPVQLINRSKRIKTYALLDNGSDVTLIDRRLAEELGLSGEPAKLNVRTIHGSTTKSCERVSLRMESLGIHEGSTNVDAYAIDHLPLAKVNEAHTLDIAKRYAHLADLTFESIPDKEVGILIGCDVPDAHWVLDQRIGRPKDPYAQKTPFGWVLRGPGGHGGAAGGNVNHVYSEVQSVAELSEKLYESEFKDLSDPEVIADSIEDRKALAVVESSVQHDGVKYAVGVPWKCDGPKLSENVAICAAFVLRKTALDYGTRFLPRCFQAVFKNLYVDDCLPSVSTIEEAVKVAHQLRDMLKWGGSRLTKWISNFPEALSEIDKFDGRGAQSQMGINSKTRPSTLRLRWNVETNILGVNLSISKEVFSRRGVLSCLSSLYDPLGVVAPLLLPARKFLQDLCYRGLGWDSPLSEADQLKWTHWLECMRLASQIEIPRCLTNCLSQVEGLELHLFCDASEIGYGAVAYLRSYYPDGTVQCSFLIGKSRVTPRKAVTVPRLELTAAVLSVKLLKYLLKELKLGLLDAVLWTDSIIVLRYLHNSATRFATFVANRVRMITDITTASQWRYVPSELNPADVASRGAKSPNSDEMLRWLRGPEFLLADKAKWP